MKYLLAIALLTLCSCSTSSVQWSATPYAQWNDGGRDVENSWSCGMSLTLFSSIPATLAVPSYANRQKVVVQNYNSNSGSQSQSQSQSSGSGDTTINGNAHNSNH
jgi:hypothetical protein